MTKLGWIILLAVVATCCWRGWIQVRLAQENVEIHAIVAAQESRIAELEQRVIEADTLILAAQVYADNVTWRAWEKAFREGLPMYIADGRPGMEADPTTAPD